jgi:glucose/arabinose dehydrogenase
VKRRDLVGAGAAGLGGLALTSLIPSIARADGTLVSPDPIVPRIEKGPVVVGLVDFSSPPVSSTQRPLARLNYLLHAKDGASRVYVCDTRGKLWLINTSDGSASLFLDVKKALGDAFPTPSPQMGLRSFAFHPDFALSGRPGYRRLYTVHTGTAASRAASVPLFSMAPSTPVDHHNVITEWRVYSTLRTRVDPASRREVLRIAQHRTDHSTDTALFNPTAKIGEADYGKLYIGTGDGGNTPDHPDMYNHAQDPLRALGKILRIDPLPQSNGRRYGVPADNPFVGKPGWLPEIWALGFRHPQNLCFDPATGVLYNTDIGQAYIEEVNIIVRGGNYGWPFREGTFVTDRNDETKLYALPENDATNGYIYPVAQYDHSEGFTSSGQPVVKGSIAITGGFVYRPTGIPALVGHYIFGDMVNGRIFHVPVSELRLGSQTTIKELTLTRNGVAKTLQQIVGTTGRVDLRFGLSESGSIYVMTKQDGKIRRLVAT